MLTFDTYKAVKALRDAGFDDAQAEAVTEQISVAIDESVATKDDAGKAQVELRAEVTELRTELGQVRTELKADVAELRTELKADVAELRTELGQVRTELKADVAELRTELGQVRTELKADVAELRAELGQVRTELKADEAKSRAESRSDMEKLELRMTNKLYAAVAGGAGLIKALDFLFG